MKRVRGWVWLSLGLVSAGGLVGCALDRCRLGESHRSKRPVVRQCDVCERGGQSHDGEPGDGPIENPPDAPSEPLSDGLIDPGPSRTAPEKHPPKKIDDAPSTVPSTFPPLPSREGSRNRRPGTNSAAQPQERRPVRTANEKGLGTPSGTSPRTLPSGKVDERAMEGESASTRAKKTSRLDSFHWPSESEAASDDAPVSAPDPRERQVAANEANPFQHIERKPGGKTRVSKTKLAPTRARTEPAEVAAKPIPTPPVPESAVERPIVDAATSAAESVAAAPSTVPSTQLTVPVATPLPTMGSAQPPSPIAAPSDTGDPFETWQYHNRPGLSANHPTSRGIIEPPPYPHAPGASSSEWASDSTFGPPPLARSQSPGENSASVTSEGNSSVAPPQLMVPPSRQPEVERAAEAPRDAEAKPLVVPSSGGETTTAPATGKVAPLFSMPVIEPGVNYQHRKR